MKFAKERKQICRIGAYLAARGLSPGTSGNLSVRAGGGWLVTPTNASLGTLDPDGLSLLDSNGEHVDGAPPTKERALHLAVYREVAAYGAIIHLHSTYAVALSCLSELNSDDAVPPITPYAVMRLGRVRLLDYLRPGDTALAERVGAASREHHVILLANHGPVFAAASLDVAAGAAEELEEVAKLYFLLHGHPSRLLTNAQVEELRPIFAS